MAIHILWIFLEYIFLNLDWKYKFHNFINIILTSTKNLQKIITSEQNPFYTNPNNASFKNLRYGILYTERICQVSHVTRVAILIWILQAIKQLLCKRAVKNIIIIFTRSWQFEILISPCRLPCWRQLRKLLKCELLWYLRLCFVYGVGRWFTSFHCIVKLEIGMLYFGCSCNWHVISLLSLCANVLSKCYESYGSIKIYICDMLLFGL